MHHNHHHNRSIYVLGVLILSAIIISITNALQLDIDNSLLSIFSGINQNYSTLHFSYNNQFGGFILWRSNDDLSVPEDVQFNSDIVEGCTQQLRGLYYSNPRGNRLRPLDESSLSGLKNWDSSYNTMTITGGLYTNCGTGADKPDEIYGAVGQTRAGQTYWLVAGTDYQYNSNSIGTNLSGSTSKTGIYDATGRLFDNQGGIALIASSTGDIPLYCGDGIINGAEQCDDGVVNGQVCSPGSNACNYCSNTCTIQTVQPEAPVVSTPLPSPTPRRNSSSAMTVEQDDCPKGDYSASYYDNTCGEKSNHSAAEILDEYEIIHGDYNKGPEDPERYQLNRFLKRGELRKIMVRTLTDQKFEEPYQGGTWASRYQYDLEKEIGISYGSQYSHQAMVTYYDAIVMLIESLKYQEIISENFNLSWFPGSGRIIKRGQMMQAIVRFILPGALKSIEKNVEND